MKEALCDSIQMLRGRTKSEAIQADCDEYIRRIIRGAGEEAVFDFLRILKDFIKSGNIQPLETQHTESIGGYKKTHHQAAERV